MTVVYPYPVIAGDVELRVAGGNLDGGTFPKNPFTPDQRLIQLYDLDKANWKTVRLDLELMGPNEEMLQLDKSGADLKAIAVVSCQSTQLRQGIVLERVGTHTAKWYGFIELERENFEGKVLLTGLVTGVVSNRRDRYLAESEGWSIYFDEPDLPPLHGTLNVKWVDFKNPGDFSFLIDHSTQPYFTDLSGKVPTLFLNRNVEFAGHTALLDDRRRSKWEKALHDSERVGIARSVWLAMFNVAVAAISEGESGSAPDWPPEEWKRKVLESVLPQIYPDVSTAESLSRALEDRNSPHGRASMESKAEFAINQLVGTGRILKQTLNALATEEIPSIGSKG